MPNWAQWVDRGCAARETRLTRLSVGMVDVGAACQAFNLQLVGPVLARARRMAQSEDILPSKEVYRIVGSTLFAELTAETVFARAADWYARSERIEAELATLPAGTAAGDAWLAAIPGAVIRVDAQDIEIVPLTSRAMLVDEAGAGSDADGVAGLNNLMAAKRHVESCLGGHRCVVSLRTHDAAGARVRLSTAAIRFDFEREPDPGAPLIVVLHRGRDAGAPPAEAAQALETYCARFRAPDPALHVDRAVLAARRSRGNLDASCGYDAANDANIAVALRLWQALLPERLRGLSLDAFAAALGSTVAARRHSPATWRSRATASWRSAASRVRPGARSTPTGSWSRPAGSTCTPIMTGRQCGTRCSRPRAGMASPR